MPDNKHYRTTHTEIKFKIWIKLQLQQLYVIRLEHELKYTITAECKVLVIVKRTCFAKPTLQVYMI
jgi:hypothetical protein